MLLSALLSQHPVIWSRCDQITNHHLIIACALVYDQILLKSKTELTANYSDELCPVINALRLYVSEGRHIS